MALIKTKTSDKLIEKKVESKQVEIKYVGDYEPKYATDGSACFDLAANQKERIFPGECVLVDLGIKIEIPKGYYMELIPRSSIYKSGLMLANSVGIIDADYRGPVMAALINVSKLKVMIQKDERIMQAIIKPVQKVSFKKEISLSTTERGVGGMGSTGK